MPRPVDGDRGDGARDGREPPRAGPDPVQPVRAADELGRLDEARQVVEECLAVFEEVDDLTSQAKALSALADLWDERGDVEQAISLARQALSVTNRLPDPADRAISHNNLGNYFDDSGRIEDGAAHHMAAGIYDLVSGHHDPNWLNNLKIQNPPSGPGRRDLRPAPDRGPDRPPRIPAPRPVFNPARRGPGGIASRDRPVGGRGAGGGIG